MGQLPEKLAVSWEIWIADLNNLRKTRISRCHSHLNHAVVRELHTFVDASERTYAAAVNAGGRQSARRAFAISFDPAARTTSSCIGLQISENCFRRVSD
ncbi:hypothetical protein EVAR_27967_1 [Eumeta japonica]|uniref:Uncharacterized protein n=1 Tax=Eumeta variegata TaxID=151549 RepID=A0A4C1WDP0_EUMVA|nr:hypothetical protein EVAR_27967_1 [Eumeta japonica]